MPRANIAYCLKSSFITMPKVSILILNRQMLFFIKYNVSLTYLVPVINKQTKKLCKYCKWLCLYYIERQFKNRSQSSTRLVWVRKTSMLAIYLSTADTANRACHLQLRDRNNRSVKHRRHRSDTTLRAWQHTEWEWHIPLSVSISGSFAGIVVNAHIPRHPSSYSESKY